MRPESYFTCLLFVLQFGTVRSQVFLSEGFESGSRPAGWTEEYVNPPNHSEPWRYRNGGHSPNDNNWLLPPDSQDLTRNPSSAYEGKYNAIFFKQSNSNERTKLITPPLDLEGGIKVELSFWLCQVPWTFDGIKSWDVLRVYYKISETSPWVLLHEYMDPLYDWELQTLVLPDLSPTYYIAFEGHTRWGFGTCIDNVVIEEKGFQQLWINEIQFAQPNTSIVPSGSTDVPLMRIGFKVFGNTGSAVLDHVNFKSLNTSDSDIKPGSVKLYRTLSQTFCNDDQVGSSTGFIEGTASFSGIDYSLPRGQSYLWLAVDLSPDAGHGNILDVMVEAGMIMANDTLYPATDQSPPGNRIIVETIYFENFETGHNWSLSGEFEVDIPNGKGGMPGNPNPKKPYSGTRVLGTDLSGLGAHPYNYEPLLTGETAYRATSPVIDALYYHKMQVIFQRHLNIEVWDQASVQVSKDNGKSWTPVWVNNGFVSDFEWTRAQLAVPENLSRTDQFRIRFQLGPTDGQNNYSGWNIDDIFLTGEFISKDVGVTEWIYPLSGCGLTDKETVVVRIGNFGGADITEPFPVGYSFDGGVNWTVDMCNEIIPVGGSVVYTFPTPADLSAPGYRQVVLAKTMMPGDQFAGNDQFKTSISVVPVYSPPYHEDFEASAGFWHAAPGSIWEYGIPSGTVINSASSGNKSWVTGLSNKYGNLISEFDQTVFEDNFETIKGWTFTGEFERNIPLDYPYFAWSGIYCIGTDLSGQGAVPYMYEKGITPLSAFTAISPALDVSSFSNLNISFKRFLSINEGDSVMVAVSPDNGTTWHRLWQNIEGEIKDEDWNRIDIEIDDSLAYSSELKIKFSLFHSSVEGEPDFGLNIDDFLLTGDIVNRSVFTLNSPCFDPGNLDRPVFEAMIWADTEQGVDGATLLYSTDGGTSWINVSNSSGFDQYWNWYTGKPVASLGTDGWSGQTGGWTRVRHLLPPELTEYSNVQFRMDFMAGKYNNNFDGIALDDVKIYEAPHDAGITAILYPSSSCDLAADEKFTLRVKNHGIRDMHPGDILKIGYMIDRAGELQTADETYVLATLFPAGATLDISMNSTFDFSTGGEYHADVYTIENEPLFYGPDANDLVSAIILVEKPVFSLGPDIHTHRPDTIVLDAWAGVDGLDYMWQDNSTGHVYHVSTEGIYYVRVTNSLGCYATDTIGIYRLIADVGVKDVISPLSSCELENSSTVTISIENSGTDTLRINDIIVISGELDQSVYFSDSLRLTENFYPGTELEFTFTRQFDFSSPAHYNLKLYTSMENDFNTSNDTMKYDFHVFGNPVVDLGADREEDGPEYILDPGPGFTRYLWQDGSSDQQFVVRESGQGTYHVRVTDINNCSASDTVLITLNVHDLAVDLLSPVTSCISSDIVPVSVRIANTGNLALLAGETILSGYTVDGANFFEEEIVLATGLAPGGAIDHLFSEKAVIIPGSEHLFTVFVNYPDDINQLNDTVIMPVSFFANPHVDLGPESQVITALEYILDAGEGFDGYLWQDGSGERTFTVNVPGIKTYSVKVTDSNGCTAFDQIQILLVVPDIGVVDIILPETACQSSSGEPVQIAIKNLGNSNMSTLTGKKRHFPLTDPFPSLKM
jgi:hypothetical protein